MMSMNNKPTVNHEDKCRMTPLLSAVERSDKTSVKSLLEAGEDINLKCCYGNTPLHLAKDIEIIKALLDKGADVRAKNLSRETPVHYIRFHDNELGLNLLLDAGARINARDLDGNTVLHKAVANGRFKETKVLLRKGAKCNVKNKCGSSPVNIAAIEDSHTSLNILLGAGADVNLKEKYGNSPLHNAAGASYNTIKILLDNGADVEARNRYGAAPIHLFAAKGNHIGIQLLLNAGAKVNVTDKHSKTPLHNVVYNFKYFTTKAHSDNGTKLTHFLKNMSANCHFKLQDYETSLSLLLNAGASVNTESVNCPTPLHFAAFSGNSTVVKTLLDNGAVVENYYKLFRPLHFAAMQDDLLCLKVLLDAGAVVQLESDTVTPLLTAAGREEYRTTKKRCTLINPTEQKMCLSPLNTSPKVNHKPTCFDLLLEKGANLNHKSRSGNTPLHYAAKNGRCENINKLINKGCDVNALNVLGVTALHFISQSHQFCTKLLVDSGANVNIACKRGITPLHVAANHGCAETVKILLDNGADWRCKDKTCGDTPLHRASLCNKGGDLCVELLLQAGADVNATNNDGFTALHRASSAGYWGTIKTLLNNGAEVDAKTKSGRTALLISTLPKKKSSIKSCVEVLLEAGADVNVCDNSRGNTPLHNLVEIEFPELLKTLINKGANLSARNKQGFTPFHFALFNRFDSCIAVLVDAGADIMIRHEDSLNPLVDAIRRHLYYRTKILVEGGADIQGELGTNCKPLITAVCSIPRLSKRRLKSTSLCVDNSSYTKCYEIIQLLLDKGANLEARGGSGSTVLHHAAAFGNRRILKILVDAGVDVNVRDENGNTLLHYSSCYGNTETLHTLLNLGGDINAINQNGETPLHVYLTLLDTNIYQPCYLRLMLRKGADVNIRDKDGNTPLHHFVKIEDPQTSYKSVKLILKSGALVNAENEDGDTPLDCVPGCQHMKTLKELLLWGASCSRRRLNFVYTVVWKMYEIMMNMANLYVGRIVNSSHFKNFEKICFEEVKKMKAFECGGLRVYDLFSLCNSSDPTIIRNAQIIQLLSSSRLKHEFPNYSPLLEVKFQQAKTRHKLLNVTVKCFQVQIPNEIKRKILAYLDNDCLNNIIEVVIQRE